MNLLIQFLIYYIINFSFIIKSDCSQTRNDISCPDNSYYDSLNCTCKECTSGKINENICYNSQIPKSIYGFVDLKDIEECKDGKLTELDDQGLWSRYLMCAKTSIPLLDEDQASKVQISPNDIFSFQFYMLSSPNKLDSGISTSIPLTSGLGIQEIQYYTYSCIYGFYEKSCNFLINLCALSMYSSSNVFCQKVNGDLTTKIKEAYDQSDY